MRDKKGRFLKGAVSAFKGKKHTEEAKEKNRLAHLGKKASKETRKKMSLYRAGMKLTEEWKKNIGKGNKNKIRSKKSKIKNKLAHLGKKASEETKKKMSLSHKGNKGRTGQKTSIETRKKMSKTHKRRRKLNHFWKGGATSKNIKIRTGLKYRLWRESVFERDDWTCQKYNIRGCKLEAHHIKNFSNNENLRFEVNNGITFSLKAHKEFHKIYGLKNNNINQINDFLTKK